MDMNDLSALLFEDRQGAAVTDIERDEDDQSAQSDVR
jgi:hypothetical protein